MSQSPIVLPIATVQADFESLITDVKDGLVPEDKFWVSCYKAGEQSVHGKVHLMLNEHNRNVVEYKGQDGVEFGGDDNKRAYTAACPSLAIPHTTVAIPTRTYSDPLPQSREDSYRKIAAFDVAPDGSQFAAGYDDGTVYIVSTSSSITQPNIAKRCHMSTITSLRFFPSSRVLLTAGNDFALSILPADPPSSSSKDPLRVSPVRTLKGHTRAVTCTGIVARGRTVLSGSKDATLRLWDVSTGAQIRTLGSAGLKPVLALTLGVQGEGSSLVLPDGEPAASGVELDPREVETQDKVVFCALEDGTFQAFDLGTKGSVFHSQKSTNSPLNAVAYSPNHNLLATGSGKGVVNVYDTRSLGAPLVSFSRNTASIEDLEFLPFSSSSGGTDVGLAIATEDGLPYVANVRPDGPSVYAELVGTDCDAVRSIRVGSAAGTVWTAGDDGIVRQYEKLGGK